jgi:hypothetical protein
MNTTNCIFMISDCFECEMYDPETDECFQDEDQGGTGHGDESYSDADPGL